MTPFVLVYKRPLYCWSTIWW